MVFVYALIYGRGEWKRGNLLLLLELSLGLGDDVGLLLEGGDDSGHDSDLADGVNRLPDALLLDLGGLSGRQLGATGRGRDQGSGQLKGPTLEHLDLDHIQDDEVDEGDQEDDNGLAGGDLGGQASEDNHQQGNDLGTDDDDGEDGRG